MEPDNLRFGGGVSHTFLSPIVLIAILIVAVLICFCERKKALAGFLTTALLIPSDQVLVLGSVHFPMLRILAICGLVRICVAKFSRQERVLVGGLNGLDKAVIALTTFTMIDGILLWQVWPQVVFQIGNVISAFGAYFLLRYLIRDIEDAKYTIQIFVGVAASVAAIMGYEKATGVNLLYSSLGGARADVLSSTVIRDGVLRASGPFDHPILAGTFGGILFPLFVGLWWRQKSDRKYAVLGIVAALVISFTASSSTALFGLIGGVVGLCFWPLRRQMRPIRWGILFMLVGLHAVMKAPVWQLIARIDLTGSSSSDHRYQLINQCILHFWDWALVGTKGYANWGWDMWDLCNQYVALADPSGLIPLVSFVALIVLGFKYVGKARRSATDRNNRLFVWGLSAALFANVVAFFGVSYFDQTIVAWYALLAMISAVAIRGKSVSSQVAVLTAWESVTEVSPEQVEA